MFTASISFSEYRELKLRRVTFVRARTASLSKELPLALYRNQFAHRADISFTILTGDTDPTITG